MSEPTKLAQLRKIMKDHSLSAEDVSVLCKRSIGTVYVWLTESQTRPIPDETLELLALKAPNYVRPVPAEPHAAA